MVSLVMLENIAYLLGVDPAWDFRARAGSGFASSGSGRVGPGPD